MIWSFSGFDVVGGITTQIMIATLPADTTVMSVAAATSPLIASLQPETTSNDAIAVLANYDVASTSTSDARQAALDSALRVLNPHDNSPNSIDCVSCHTAQPAIQLVGEPLGMSMDGNPNAFVADPSIPAADLAQTTQLIDDEQVLNVHAFSYRGTSPMVNQRVINETAANLALIKALM